MNRKLDQMDFVVAAALAVFIAGWAFLWAQPYPHPDLWPFLAAIGNRVPLAMLGICGKLGLGLFAALAYLLMRGSWTFHRDIEDDLADAFFFTRFVPLCATLALTCLPFVWRTAQFASPGFVLTLVLLVGLAFWQFARFHDGLASYLLAYTLLAFGAGLTPLAFIVLGYVGITDIVSSGRLAQAKDQDEAVKAFVRRSAQNALSLVGMALGFVAAVAFGAFYFAQGFPEGGIIGLAIAWWTGYTDTFWPVVTSTLFVSLAVGTILIIGALALGRRIRATGPQTRAVAIVLSSLVGIAAVMMVLRAVDLPERQRLALLGEYVRTTVADAEEIRWFFTDGRFDEGLKYEAKRQGRRIVLLDALNAPSEKDSERLRGYAPEPGDRKIFAAGGSEVFKAWARERADRLKASVWLFGGGIVRRFGKVQQRTCGSLLRGADEAAKERFDAADRAFEDFSRRLFACLVSPVTHGVPFGSVDRKLSETCDAMLWRAARQAGERSEALKDAAKLGEAQRERGLMQELDVINASLRSQGNMLERLLPTSNLVLTPRESLEIALKRADFFLAQRYANEVLFGTPDDVQAHFALGMYDLETQDFFAASQHFETILKAKPEEPAVLNNLALAYLKLGQIEKARKTAEHAAKVNPKSVEIQKNLKEIQNQSTAH